MNTELVVRAWKDPEFRASLTPEQRASLPECPAGTSFTEMDEVAARDAVGGSTRASTVHDYPDCTYILTGCYPMCAL